MSSFKIYRIEPQDQFDLMQSRVSPTYEYRMQIRHIKVSTKLEASYDKPEITFSIFG